MKIGAQLYTVRETTKTLESFSETLKRIADIGYKFVQVSGTCEYEPRWLEEQLKQTGLSCVLTHSNMSRIENETNAVIEDHKIFNCTRIGIGGTDMGSLEAINEFITKFKPVTQLLRKNGMYFMYHNHGAEFSKFENTQGVALDLLCEAFEPGELGITLDTYWVQFAGGDPTAWLTKLKGRTPCIHLKDMEFSNKEQKMAPVGQGNMNFEGILKAAVDSKVEYGLVEQDDCYEEDPFACLKKSYNYLVSRGFN
ncbi:MAG: sugar phosphate isomerase/epimerase [Oscillospiraceae bacterium]